MSGTASPPDLQLHDDPRLQQRQWTVQRIGQVLIALFVLAALIGVFGGGLVGETRAGSPDRLEIQYFRFWRTQAPMPLTVRVSPAVLAAAAAAGELRLSVSDSWLGRLEIHTITPAPERIELAGGAVVLVYPVRGAAGPATIRLTAEARQAGRVGGAIGLEGDERPVSFGHFIYP